MISSRTQIQRRWLFQRKFRLFRASTRIGASFHLDLSSDLCRRQEHPWWGDAFALAHRAKQYSRTRRDKLTSL